MPAKNIGYSVRIANVLLLRSEREQILKCVSGKLLFLCGSCLLDFGFCDSIMRQVVFVSVLCHEVGIPAQFRGDILEAATSFQIPNRTGVAQIAEVNIGELRSLQYLLVEAANHRR